MVDLKTVIDELSAGKIEFIYIDDDCCTTIGEVVVFLKQLAELTEENKRQKSEIERLEKANSFKKNQIDGLKKLLKRADEIKAEAIKEFAWMFDNVLIGMRERYNHSNCCEYGAVCEFAHRQLLRCLKEMEERADGKQ